MLLTYEDWTPSLGKWVHRVVQSCHTSSLACATSGVPCRYRLDQQQCMPVPWLRATAEPSLRPAGGCVRSQVSGRGLQSCTLAVTVLTGPGRVCGCCLGRHACLVPLTCLVSGFTIVHLYSSTAGQSSVPLNHGLKGSLGVWLGGAELALTGALSSTTQF